jgi:hypothetical protein
MEMTRILRFARLRYIVMEERYAQFAALFSRRRDHQDGGPIMKRLGMLGIIGGAAILTAVPFSLQWSQKNVTLSLASAEAQERPLTATSVAGVSPRVHRRAYRRAYRSAAYASAAGYGHGLYSGHGYPAYSSYWIPYGTSYAAPYGVYSSSYAIAYERLKSGYAAPYGPIFY